MIDTHAHLDEILCDTRGGVSQIILAASNLEDSKNNLKLAKKYNFLYPAIGIHPQSPSLKEAEELEEIITNKVIAIGECGLELIDNFDRKKQEICFRIQIELAQKNKLPLIVHARKAVDETIEILKDYKNISGVFHCYAGGSKRIKKIEDLGFYFGIDGNLTYEDGLVEVVKKIPQERLILETDCPYLTPVPFRGQENKPAFVEYTYKKVSEVWGESFEKTEKVIDENAKRLFKII